MTKIRRRVFSSLILVFGLSAITIGCQTASEPDTPTPAPESEAESGIILQAAEEITLAPTYTRPASNGTNQTQLGPSTSNGNGEPSSDGESGASPVAPSSPTPTVDLNQPVIRFRIEIPAIDLDRSFEGNISGRTELTDYTAERSEVLSNQNRRLIEIQSVLRDLTLEPLPTGCERCAFFSFSLPVEGIEAEGHLTDPIVLASVHHFLSQTLGPHFPLETLIGHHRSASGYTAAHTAVLLEDGTIWRWFGSDTEIVPAEAVESELLALYTEAADLFDPLEPLYDADCANFPIETVRFREKRVEVRCPELSLPTLLASSYETASALSAPQLLDERNLIIPSTVLPLNSVIFFERSDGATLTLYEDGLVVTLSATGETVTTTIPAREIEPLIEPMVSSEIIPRGVTVSIASSEQNGELSVDEEAEYEELILIRGTLGVYEFAWTDRVGQTLVPGIAVLDLLLEEKIGPASVENEVESESEE